MNEQLLAPKFLTMDVAETAVETVIGALFDTSPLNPMKGLLPRKDRGNCHVVVLVPAIKDDRANDFRDWPNYPIKPEPIYEGSFGEPATWQYPFKEIARCKASQLWEGQNDGRGPTAAHLLLPGDTPYWGGVKREGIVVAVSGFDEHFDRMAAGMIAEICIALARQAYLESEDVKDGANFLR